MALLPEAHALVLQQVYVLLSPAVLITLFGVLLSKYTGVNVPLWAVALGAMLSLPILHRVKAMYSLWSDGKRGARIGAVLPPIWTGNKIASVDILNTLMKAWYEGYLSKTIVL